MTLLILGAVAAFAIPWHSVRPGASQEASARRGLLAIVKAETLFREERQGSHYAQDLDVLSEATGRRIQGLPPPGGGDGYRFGIIGTDEQFAQVDPALRFAYYAVPEAYGVSGTRILIVDTEGRLYAKDLGRAEPPPAWPASDPTSAGWIALGQ